MKSEVKTITRNLSISLALIGGAALAPQALADDGYALAFEPAQIRSVEDMQRLHARIQDLAKAQCPTSKGVQAMREAKNCRAEITADLVNKVNLPAFSAYVEDQSRETVFEQVASNN